MFKPIFIIVLVAAQLMAGLSATRYLCLHKDGSTCGVFGGAESCNCGHHDHTKHSHKCCAAAENETVCCHHHGDSEVTNDTAVAVQETIKIAEINQCACGCTHIPLSDSQPTLVVKPVVASESLQIVSVIQFPVLVRLDQFLEVDYRLVIRRDAPPDFAVLSTLVDSSTMMRC